MNKDFNMSEARAAMDKMAMEDPEGFVRAVAGDKPKNDGGMAFPQSETAGDLSITHGGMTMRDYFAAGFAQAQATTTSADTGFIIPGYIDSRYEGLTVAQNIAKNSYALADAMLAERAK